MTSTTSSKSKNFSNTEKKKARLPPNPTRTARLKVIQSAGQRRGPFAPARSPKLSANSPRLPCQGHGFGLRPRGPATGVGEVTVGGGPRARRLWRAAGPRAKGRRAGRPRAEGAAAGAPRRPGTRRPREGRPAPAGKCARGLGVPAARVPPRTPGAGPAEPPTPPRDRRARHLPPPSGGRALTSSVHGPDAHRHFHFRVAHSAAAGTLAQLPSAVATGQLSGADPAGGGCGGGAWEGRGFVGGGAVCPEVCRDL
jgi:hypothetical protein